jgi:hypothetical protein
MGRLLKVPKQKEVGQCQALRVNGFPCGNKAALMAIWREQEIQLCSHHKDWRPDNHTGRSSHLPKLTKREKEEREKIRKRNAERCVHPNKSGDICQSMVARRDDAQRPWCYYHWVQLSKATPEQKAHIEQRVLEFQLLMASGGKIDDSEHLKTGKRPMVKDMPSMEEQLDKLEEMAQSDAEIKTIQAKPGGTAFLQRKTKARGLTLGKSQFLGIDIEHYTPDFKYDFLFLLFKQIRRAEAVVNILAEMLFKIEQEEEQLKLVETKGTMMNDQGNPVEFHNVTTRHVTPVETKLLLVDKLTKQEMHLAKLLKQLEELPLTCLTVFRKMGVKWDRKAAMMVVDAIESEKMKDVEGYADVDVEALPSRIEDVQRIVKKTGLDAQQPNMKQLSSFKEW